VVEEPSVDARGSQSDMADPLAADSGPGHLHSAVFAGHPEEALLRISAAQALIVFDWAKDPGAEETAGFGLVRAYVERSDVCHLSSRLRTKLTGACDANTQRLKVLCSRQALEEFR
jgi:hypothetical protein